MEDKIYFNFSYLALKLLGSGMYSNPWNAISELVANGFDAGASDVFIHLDVSKKDESTIEIFDNGTGMSFDDLVSKYVFVGRNKRLDDDYEKNGINKAMGRKGIGKLATLYLSNNFYLISKQRGYLSAWNLNITGLNEDERPALNPVDVNSVKVICESQWNVFEHGLCLKLTNVNLTGLGERKLSGLINRLSNFYLLNSSRRIWFSYSENNEQPRFVQVTKSIADKNFYALYNTDGCGFSDFEKRTVKVKTDFQELLEHGYPTVLLDNKNYIVRGKQTFYNDNGDAVEKEYEMVGWIAIHTTINSTEAQKNDSRFVKNVANSPNKLRLYIRGKLAIENFLDYVKSTQAFSNYIEGEISFDILDDDDLPDITTANRQQLTENDSRVQLLISILKPIITKLISVRVALSKTISEDEEKIRQRKFDELSFNLRKQNEDLKGSLLNKETQLKNKNKQIKFLKKGLHKNTKRLAEAIHVINKNSTSISLKIKSIYKKMNLDNKEVKKISSDISEIDLINKNIYLMTQYAFNGNFDSKSKIINGNIGEFIEQYFEIIGNGENRLNVQCDYPENIIVSFDITTIGIILDNVISNSIKANASNLLVEVSIETPFITICFTDDGDGCDFDSIENIDDLFDLGYRSSSSEGNGIGLYHIKKLVNRKSGSVRIDTNYREGFRLIIKIKDEKD